MTSANVLAIASAVMIVTSVGTPLAQAQVAREPCVGGSFFRGAALAQLEGVRPRVRDNLPPDESRVVELFARARPSAVGITVGNSAVGSGFVWDEHHVITNAHVVANDRGIEFTDIKVAAIQERSSETTRLRTGLRHLDELPRIFIPADVHGLSLWHDLAVLRIDPQLAADARERLSVPLRPLIGARYVRRARGQRVYAMGDTLRLEQTFTSGILSGDWRTEVFSSGIPLFDLIQTDASTGPGGSGGLLLDSSGNVLGVNVASAANAENEIGFAVPVETISFAVSIDTVCRVVPQLISSGRYSRPRLGVMRGELTNSGGAAVHFWKETSSAPVRELEQLSNMWSNADIDERILLAAPVLERRGEMARIEEFQGFPIRGTLELWRTLDHFAPGDTVRVRVVGQENERSVTLLEAPSGSDPIDQLGNPFRMW